MLSMIVVAALINAGPVNHYPGSLAGQYITKSSCTTLAQEQDEANSLRTLFGGTLVTVWGPPTCGAFFTGWASRTASTVAARKEILFVDENAVFQKSTTEYYSGSPNQNLDRVDQRQQTSDLRFRMPHDGSGITIFIVDSGVQTINNLQSRISSGFSTVGGNPQTDADGHGTAMASLAASLQWGVARNATIQPVQVYTTGTISLNNVVSGLNWILGRPETLAVVNMSIEAPGTSGQAGMIDSQITSLKAKGFVVTAAAGNGNVDASTIDPARSSDAVTVGAMNVTTNGRWTNGTFGSNFGTVLDLFAPGASATHDTPFNGTASSDGTSGSTAYTSGTLAALFQTDLTMGASTTVSRLLAGTTANALDANTLGGSVNALLMTDIQPSINATAQLVGGTVFCPNLGFYESLNVTIQAAGTDSSNNKYYGYILSQPSLCHSSNPLDMPATTWVQKRSSAGTVLWTSAISSGILLSESIPGILVTSSDIYVVGSTGTCNGVACPGGDDAFVARLNPATGSLVWGGIKTFGTTAFDAAAAVAQIPSDASNVYIVGTTAGNYVGTNAGGNDGFLASAAVTGGTVTGKTQFGTSGNDSAVGIVPRVVGTFSVVGSTTGAFAGQTNHGGYDFFIGTILLPGFQFFVAQELGSSADDLASAATVGIEHGAGPGIDTLYVAGRTAGAAWGQNQGGFDVFLGRFDDAPSNQAVWIFQTGTQVDDYAPGVALSPDDAFAASGYELIKFSRPAGTISWRESLQHVAQTVSTTATGLATAYDSGGQATANIVDFGAF